MATLAVTFTTRAADYEFLTFELTDGAKTSVQTSGLSITFSGTTLKAGEQTFTLENLKKMYFSTSDETTGISEAKLLNNKEKIINNNVYDLQGRKVTKEQMRKGQVYVVKTNRGTHKLTVK